MTFTNLGTYLQSLKATCLTKSHVHSRDGVVSMSRRRPCSDVCCPCLSRLATFRRFVDGSRQAVDATL